MTTRQAIILSLFAAAAFGVACRQSDDAAANPPSLEAKTVCLSCKRTATTTLAKPIEDETWPKPCPACTKTSVYAYKKRCPRCADPVPLKDSQTGGFGRPKKCPACGSKTEL